MTVVAPYLSFNGTCAEAFDFYASVFGGAITMRMTYGKSPMADQVPADCADLVMHTAMSIGSFVLMGADIYPGRPYHTPQGISVMVEMESVEKVGAAFDRLAEDGHVTMPITATFWTPAFGMLTDRFGITWMLACANAG
jgi:PhnB protein